MTDNPAEKDSIIVYRRDLEIARFRYKRDLQTFMNAYLQEHERNFFDLKIKGNEGRTPK